MTQVVCKISLLFIGVCRSQCRLKHRIDLFFSPFVSPSCIFNNHFYIAMSGTRPMLSGWKTQLSKANAKSKKGLSFQMMEKCRKRLVLSF